MKGSGAPGRIALVWASIAAIAACASALLVLTPGPGARTRAVVAQPASESDASRAAELAAFAHARSAQSSISIRSRHGESFARALERAGLSRHEAVEAERAVANVAQIDPQAEREIIVGFEAGRLRAGAVSAAPGLSVYFGPDEDGLVNARALEIDTVFEIARVAAPVGQNLYHSALEGGATDKEIAALERALGFELDFQRDVRASDRFELVFERYADSAGQTLATGETFFVALDTRQGSKFYYAFRASPLEPVDWYDRFGRSARRLLTRTPIRGAQLTSVFGPRRHPILGYSTNHRGVDFAAPHSAPIFAAGAGVVTRAGPNGGYGSYVRIRHDGGFETAYAHLSGFARGARVGASVAQGDVIGFVGSSGRSTGPHLHYEVLLFGEQINPMTATAVTGRTLGGDELARFRQQTDRIDRLREERLLGSMTVAGAQER